MLMALAKPKAEEEVEAKMKVGLLVLYLHTSGNLHNLRNSYHRRSGRLANLRHREPT